MATSDDYRRNVQELTRFAETDLAAAWRVVSGGVEARELLLVILPELVAVYGSAAATLAADWYDETRDEAEIGGRFTAVPATLPDTDRTDALARWAVAPLFTPEPDFSSSLTLAQGGLQRIVANASRYTIAGSAVADPGTDGWQRVGQGLNCTFCSMLIGRGSVYSEAGADFAAHDHCNCSAAPAFRGRPRPVKPYTPSLRGSTDADRARVREYIATH